MRIKKRERLHRMLSVTGTESSVLDFTGQGIRRMEVMPNAWPTTLIYDRNAISKIENLDQYKECLQQLSIGENQLTRMGGLTRLTCITMLNVPNNSITTTDGLKNLTHLTWLNISGNCLKVVEHLQNNLMLQHLDVSDNNIINLPELSPLIHLKSLLLHGNMLSSLESAPGHLPGSLTILSLAENDLDDLNQVAYFSTFPSLEQLSVMNNPCVIMAGPHPGFDYRPFVVNWCLSLNFLDGYQISETERLRAEWLYSQGRGRHHRPGQHFALMQYLSTVCPLTAATELESLEDQKLARILQHQRLHQASLDEEARSSQGQIHPGQGQIHPDQGQTHPGQGQSRKPHTHGEPSKLLQDSPKPSTPGGNRRGSHDESTPRATHVTGEEGNTQPQGHYNSPYKGQPVKAWASGDPARNPASSVGPGSRHAPDSDRQIPSQADLQVQDISSSDDSHSLLDCETRYIPLHTSEMLISPTKPLHLQQPAPPRPITAPPTSHHHHPAPPPDHDRPASDMDETDPSHKSSLNPARRMAANFPPSSPKSTKPDAHLHAPPGARRRSTSPHSKPQISTDPVTDSDSETIPDGSATLELKLLKAILHNRKTKKAIRKSIQEGYGGQGASSYSTRDGQSRLSAQYVEGEGRYSQADMEVEQVMNQDAFHTDKTANLAATRLQATWRGFYAREKHPDVLRVRHELRTRRSEEHIKLLTDEVERQKLLYEQEKQLRVLQLEAVKHLWREVQTLQQWKDDVLQSQDMGSRNTPPNTSNSTLNDSTKQLIETLEKASIDPGEVGMSVPSAPVHSVSSPRPSVNFSHPMTKLTQPPPGSKKDVEKVESACKQLQQQVSQLQQALTSVSNFVFQGSSSSVDEAGPVETLILRDDQISDSPPVLPNPQPDDQGQSGASRPLLRPGVPTPPSSLQADQRTPGSVLLQWNPSFIPDSQGLPSNNVLIGYRVYINDRPKGMVGGKQTKSLLEGLSTTLTYRVYLRAVSALGESFDSNVVIISPQSAVDEIRLSQILPDHGDDPDSNSHSGRHQDHPPHHDGSGRDPGGPGSSQPPDPAPTDDGTGPTSRSAGRDASNSSRIPTLKTRNLLHVQFDDLESSKGSLDVSKGSAMLDSTSKGSLDVSKGSAMLDSTSKDVTMLDTDSGYSTTLGSLNQKDSSRLSTKASVAPSISIETVQEESSVRKATDRLEQKLRNQKDMEGKISPLSTQESKNVVNKILDLDRPATPSGSPRIQEGLIKRLEQSRDKSMLGELKFAAKIHKRRNESPTPLRAIPSELNRAEALAAEITGKREGEGTSTTKGRTGVVPETPERLSRNKELEQNGLESKTKPEDKISQGQSELEERRYSDPKIQGEESRERRRGRALSEEAEEKLKAYFSRHDSLRYRVKVPTTKPRLRRNSGGEEQDEPEKDTPAVQNALEKYRERTRNTPQVPEEVREEVEGETRVSPATETRVSPASDKTPATDKTSGSGKAPVSDKPNPSSPREKKYTSRSNSPSETPERKIERKSSSPSSRLPRSPRSGTSDRRVLPNTPDQSCRANRASPDNRNISTKSDQTPPAVPPRSYKSLKDSGLRTHSQSPGKRRSERSREGSPSVGKNVPEKDETGEGMNRKGSLRRRQASSGSEASSGSNSPQKHSSDEMSSSSRSTTDSRSHRAERTHQRLHDESPPTSNNKPEKNSQDLKGKGTDDMVRHTRGRRSARETRSTNQKVEVGQRSSSVGAVVDRIMGGCCTTDTVVVTDKPPMARREGSKENLQSHKSSRENLTHKGSRENIAQKPPLSRTSSKEDVGGGRRSTRRSRTHSEHSAAGSSEDDDGSLVRSGSRESFSDRKSSGERSGSGDMSEALQAALLTPAKTSPRDKEPSGKKPLLKHKRSNSDLSGIRALPDRPESPAPKDWKPSKPNQAPTSPRVIRSSSFSKLIPGQDGSADSPDAILRQCISLETLKAAKSHDVSHFEAKRASQSESPAQQESPPPTTGLMFDKGAVVRRSLERCYNRNKNQENTEPKNRPHSMGSLDKRDERAASDGATKARRASDYSFSSLHDGEEEEEEEDEDVRDVVRELEKLHAQPSQAISDDRSTRLEELRERRNKLGTKAADLFNKLQLRLSANKT